MHYFFLLARVYPWWALPAVVVVGQLGIVFRRKNKAVQYVFFGMAAVMVLGLVFWLVYRGDLNSDQWVREAIR